MSQTIDIVEAAKKGSIQAEVGSGINVMSDSLIAFQPAIEEPSNIRPSAKASSLIRVWSKVTCCHLPRGSVKRRSTYLTSLSLIALRTSLAVFMFPSWVPWSVHPPSAARVRQVRIFEKSDGVRPGFAGSDANCFL